MRLAWLTDIHLNFLEPPQRRRFLSGVGHAADAVAVSGDIGESDNVEELLAAGLLDAAPHPLRLGRVEDLPYFARQERLTFARVGIIEPTSVDDFVAHGGYEGLRRALGLPGAAIVQEVLDSGLRGRGGAAFPTGIKWKTVLEQSTAQKYVVCNADEGDSGTFSDRMLMEGDPLTLV